MKKFRIVTDRLIIVSKRRYAVIKHSYRLPLLTRFIIGASESITFKNPQLRKLRKILHDFVQLLFDVKVLTFMTPGDVIIEFTSPNKLISDALEGSQPYGHRITE